MASHNKSMCIAKSLGLIVNRIFFFPFACIANVFSGAVLMILYSLSSAQSVDPGSRERHAWWNHRDAGYDANTCTTRRGESQTQGE